jgi:uncharacterized protein (TIGR00730 family)
MPLTPFRLPARLPEEPKLKRLIHLKGEADFLAGRHTRRSEFFRVVRIALEFIRGFRALHFVGPSVTVFGSARFTQEHPFCELARQTGKAIGELGFTVITGGGPGIMQAASRGAKEAGARTVGCNIFLPHEQRSNPFVDRAVTFTYFFVRKVMLVKYSYGFVILPGGMGTLDELTEAITLIQTGKLYDFPVILMGTEYWKGFLDWCRNTLIPQGAIAAEDIDRLVVTDDPVQVAHELEKLAGFLGIPGIRGPQTPSTATTVPASSSR